MKKTNEILKYMKQRCTALGAIIDYYDTKERDNGFLKTDDQIAYQIAMSQMNELERLTSFIEGK